MKRLVQEVQSRRSASVLLVQDGCIRSDEQICFGICGSSEFKSLELRRARRTGVSPRTPPAGKGGSGSEYLRSRGALNLLDRLFCRGLMSLGQMCLNRLSCSGLCTLSEATVHRSYRINGPSTRSVLNHRKSSVCEHRSQDDRCHPGRHQMNRKTQEAIRTQILEAAKDGRLTRPTGKVRPWAKRREVNPRKRGFGGVRR